MHNRILAYKRKLIKEIKAVVEPHLWQSGYIKSPLLAEKKEYLKLYVWPTKAGEELKQFRSEKYNVTIEGFTEEGIVVDNYCAIATISYNELMYEQLAYVRKIADKIVATPPTSFES